MARHEQFAAWKESIAVIFDVEPLERRTDGGFRATLDAVMLGPVMLARCNADLQEFCRSAATIGRDGMDHFMIQFYEMGSQSIRGAGMELLHDRGSMLVYDLTRPVEAQASRFCNLSLVVPRQMLADQLLHPDDHHMRYLPFGDPMGGVLYDFLRSAMARADHLSASQAGSLGRMAVAMAAECMNAGQGEMNATDRIAGLSRMTRIRRLIAENLDRQDLGPDWLAEQIGVSRSKLYRLFDSSGGIVELIRNMRMQRAMQMLQDPAGRGRVLLDIAMEVGYGSDTAFGRAFKQRFGMTPGELRAGGRSLIAHGHDTNGLDRRYEDWLRLLNA